MLHVTWIIFQVIKIYLKSKENANANGSHNSLKKSFVYNLHFFPIKSFFIQIYTESVQLWNNNYGILCIARPRHKTPWCWALTEREWILCAQGVLSSISCASQHICAIQIVALIYRNTFYQFESNCPLKQPFQRNFWQNYTDTKAGWLLSLWKNSFKLSEKIC